MPSKTTTCKIDKYFNRDIGDGFSEYEGIVSVPKRSHFAKLSYNYCAIVNRKEIPEFVFNHGDKSLTQRQLNYNMLEKKGINGKLK